MPTYDNCYICGKQEATKKNSHIIPSFLIALIFNYDGSSKRGKEVMVTITPVEEKVYIGELPDTKIDTLFDQEKLTDERIESELRINTASRDYIFCPKCENDLSKYLESPYSSDYKNGNNTDPVTAYFFWLSVIWRIYSAQLTSMRVSVLYHPLVHGRNCQRNRCSHSKGTLRIRFVI